MSGIESDVVAEAERLATLAEAEEEEEEQVVVRLLGGVAIRLHGPEQPAAAFVREYADLDFVTVKKGSRNAQRFFARAGYSPQVAFNALNSQERLLFFDEEHGRQIDVFVGQFRMCHEIPLGDRLALERRTIPLAELLLTKLQVIELNEKDVRDALALLHGHDIGESDVETVNAGRVAALCADDWGLWRTITRNLAACREHREEYGLPPDERAVIARRIDALLERIEAEPKSRRWRLRAKVGERKRWYDLPEEVRR
jgi:hypothetical protein